MTSGLAKRFWESIDYEEHLSRGIKNYLRAEAKKLRKLVRNDSVVLDVGCGSGRCIALLKKTARKIVGVDYSTKMIKKAFKKVGKCSNVELFLENAESMPFADNSFDYVLCMFNTLGVLDGSKEKALMEIKRVVKPKGKIFASVYSENALDEQVKEYTEYLGLTIKKIDADAVYTKKGFVSERFGRAKIKRLFGSAGLKAGIIKLTPIAYFIEACRE